MKVHELETDIKLTNNDKKKLKDKMHKFKSFSKEKTKKICKLCKNEVQGFANSHTIPQSVLKRLTVNGKLYDMNTILNTDYAKKVKGIKESETFNCICDKCENLFSEYENGDLWVKLNDNSLRDRVLLEIKVKNILQKINIREELLRLYNGGLKELEVNRLLLNNYVLREQNEVKIIEAQGFKKLNEIDFVDWNNELNHYRKFLINKNSNCKVLFVIKYMKKLDYVLPIALQEDEYYMHDTKWCPLNDVYDLKQSHKIKALSVCIFPQENSTLILMFVENNCRTYNDLILQFDKMSLEEQLKWLTFYTFSYTQGYCLSNKVDISHLEGIKRVCTINENLVIGPYETERKIDIQINNRKRIFDMGFENVFSKEFRLDA